MSTATDLGPMSEGAGGAAVVRVENPRSAKTFSCAVVDLDQDGFGDFIQNFHRDNYLENW